MTNTFEKALILGKEASISYIFSFIESAEEIRRKCKSEFCRSLIIPEKIRQLECDPGIEAVANIYAIYLAFGHIDYITVGVYGQISPEFVQFMALYPGTQIVYMTYGEEDLDQDLDLDVLYYGHPCEMESIAMNSSGKSIQLGFLPGSNRGDRMNPLVWMENMNYLLAGL